MPENNVNQVSETQKDTAGKGDERSEKRYQDLANKVADLSKEKEDLLKQHEAEKAQLLKDKQEADFRSSFLEKLQTYPNAKEFEKDIKTKVLESKYSLDDAIVATLAAKGKLQTPVVKTDAAGGSAVTSIKESSKEDPSFGGDIAKMREELVGLEKKGELNLR